ncbi:ABC transporter substrate-binding protein [Pseudogracilibacillus auburnensis]|uniref:ABC transporter substrate-binding protein n=1 Tax=Pseudogracilibacillus auburnensis TaxID=1494959 RepID=UPI001A96AB1D|nr:extracellular solute-binding protein [Pseudogracilibacillus auburnensis]MBO1005433.1 extracellular solute-binding protein [Pseudogracilibacillus auburnensis]
MRKYIVKISSIFISLIVITACTNIEYETDSKEKIEDENDHSIETVDINVFTMFTEADPVASILQDIFNQVEEERSGFSIKSEAMMPGEGKYQKKVYDLFSTDQAPDITYFYTGELAEKLITETKVIPMETLLKEDEAWSNDFIPAVLDQVKADDDHIYAIPTTGFYEGLFVNTALFEQYGLDLPTDWEKYETAMKTLKENGIIPLANSINESYYLIEHYILAAGGQEGHQATLHHGIHDSWIEGLHLIKEHYDMGAFPENTITIDDLEAQQLFTEEKAAMMLNGSWVLPDIPDEIEESIQIMPMPIPPEGKGTYGDIIGGFTSGFYLSKASFEDELKREPIVQLLKELTSTKTIQQIAEANGGTPAINKKLTNDSPATDSGHELVIQATSLNVPLDSTISPEAFTYIRKNMTKIVLGELTAEQVLQGAEELDE